MSSGTPPEWFPFTRDEARAAFKWMYPPEDIDGLIAAIHDEETVGGGMTEGVLILLGLESESAASRVLKLRPDLAESLCRAQQAPAEFRRLFRFD
jgi:hypothetical protein